VNIPMLFEPLTLRSVTLPHRGWVSPMCQYSCDAVHAPGVPNDWHLVHLGSFATGGAALIIAESTAVNPEGRISPQDTGLWNDAQTEAWQRITRFVHEHSHDAKIGVQIGHAGRKGCTYAPTTGPDGTVPVAEGGWQTLAATDAAFGKYAAPLAMTSEQINAVIKDFAAAAARAVEAGFDLIELHGAHGYLVDSFRSPLVNLRTDEWGGTDEKRLKLPLAIIDAIRATIPDTMPLIVRISATDWDDIEGDLERSVHFAKLAKERGVDLIDVSAGGNLPSPNISSGPGYQTPLAARIRSESGIPVGTVGAITDAFQAEHILRTGQADGVFIGRTALADPRWWHRAAHRLGYELPWVPQYRWPQPQTTYS
jgi:2,4-dienoyl-CoA reductase-like NADH-dependent reductase (Old Yellow Enzyme family)